MEPIKNAAPANPVDVLKIIKVTTLVALFVGYGLWLFFFGSSRP